jgi:hypothetical protein
MSEMAGAVMIGLAAGTADFSIVQDTHTRIKETSDLGFVSFIRGVRGNFYHRAPLDLLRRKDAELNTHDRFDI